MDNTLLYYSPAEIEYRRERAIRNRRTVRRSTSRTAWLRRPGTDATA